MISVMNHEEHMREISGILYQRFTQCFYYVLCLTILKDKP